MNDIFELYQDLILDDEADTDEGDLVGEGDVDDEEDEDEEDLD